MECRVRFIQHARKQDSAETPDAIDLWVAGFWSGIRAYNADRSMEKLASLLAAAGGDPETVIEGFGR